MARQNINKKYLICQTLIKILKQYAIPNSSLQNLKIFSSKGYRKTSQKWIMYVANTAILELRFFSERYHFRILLLLTLKSTHYLRYKILRFVLTNHMHVYCRLTRLKKKCWFSAVYYRIWLERYQIIFVISSLLAKAPTNFQN